MTTTHPDRLIVGVTGASGTIYASSALRQLSALGIEAHVVVSKAGRLTAKYELGENADLGPGIYYPPGDVGASIASGSFGTLGMLIAPCSVRTMSEIASGVTSSLLTRAADVCLKERRRVVMMVRETPFHLGHLRTMTALTEMGAIIAPPLPAFYAAPDSIQALVDQSVGRALDLFGLANDGVRRWGEDIGPTSAREPNS